MTSIDRTPGSAGSQGPQLRAPLLRWLTGATALAAIVVTAVLAAAGHAEAATAVAVIGAGALGTSAIRVTIHVRR
ncbi:hypothetical protein ACFXEL_27670 [Streptomyces sp. NPDC059382]|uniref:hypothetical protein n=1 Tax=Streptomyces sp. NPDC059382 TaxID=3346816 RepID=UPI0036968049